MSLAKALPGQGGGNWKKTELHLGVGEHAGYFIGLGDEVVEKTSFTCKKCKGETTIKGEECRSCKGTGKKSETKVPIRYQMGPNLIEEEWVNFIITPPGQMPDGTPKSCSTLWSRLRAISGGINEPDAIVQWYDQLAEDGAIKVGIKMMILDNPKGEGVYIAQVRPIKPRSAQQPVDEAAAPQTFSDDAFGDDPQYA